MCPLQQGIRKQEEKKRVFLLRLLHEQSQQPPSEGRWVTSDIIISINGVKLVDVEGGVDAWVKVFTGFAGMSRNMVVRHAIIAADKNVMPVLETTHPPVESELNDLVSSVILRSITYPLLLSSLFK